MASLPHAPFASSNNTQSSPLLPSPLPMDHSPHNPHQYDQLWHDHLEKPPSYNPSHIIGSLGFTPHSNEKLYAGLLGNPQEQFLIAAGGEVSLLTSSWEALDKLVSANCMSTGSMNEVSDNLNCLIMGVQDGNILGSSPTYSEVEQKPLNLYGASNSKSSNGGGRIMWVPATPTSHAASACSIEKKNAGLNLAKFSADPGFADRAAKFSSYSQQMNQAYSINNVSLDSNLPTRKLGSPASNSPIKTSPVVAAPDNAMAEEPSINEGVLIIKPCIPSKNNEGPPQRSMANHGKKKRAGSKDVDMDDKGNGKRPKSGESVQISEIKAKSVMKPQQSTSGNSGDSEQKSGKQTSKASDAPKQDFIHVRARRGQATDSHSLAERVRREKISERMKYLQDLVPGCSKVTGKAVMLDEIINYVQSLQRQVEFLSMKLAAVHPSKLEFNLENLFGKEVVRQFISQNQNNVATFAPESNNINSYNPSFNRHDNLQINSSLQLVGNLPCNSRLVDVLHSLGSDGAALRRAVSSLDISSDTFGSDCISQITQAWADDDLQNVVQNMGFAQTSLLQGPLFYGQMKTEL